MTSPIHPEREPDLEVTDQVEGSVGGGKIRIIGLSDRRVAGTMHVPLACRRAGSGRPQVRIEITDGVLRDLLSQSIKGLSRSQGGKRDGESVEIKGFLLGEVEQVSDELIVTVLRHCPINLSSEDTVASAVFTAKDLAVLEQQRRNHPKLQVLGSYHSHPGHGTRLSEDDVDHLQQWFPEPFQIGVIIEPTRREIGFFVKDGAQGFAGRLDPAYLVSFDRNGRHNAPVRAIDPPPPPPPWWLQLLRRVPPPVRWVMGVAIAGVAVVAVIALIRRPTNDLHRPIQFVEEPVKEQNLTDESAKFEVAIEAIEDAVVHVRFKKGESSDKFSLQLLPDPGAVGPVELSAGDTLHVTVTAKQGELEFETYYDTVLHIEYAKEDAWPPIGAISLTAEGPRRPDQKHDWLDWGRVSVDSHGTIVVTLRRPENSEGDLSGGLHIRYRENDRTKLFSITAGQSEPSVQLDESVLGAAERWPRMEFSATCESESPTGSVMRWTSRSEDMIQRERVDAQIRGQASDYRTNNRCTITIISPDKVVGAVSYKVTKGSVTVHTGTVQRGQTDSFDYEFSSLEPHELSVKSYFYGDGDVYRAMGRVHVESPDWGFVKNQGPEGRRVRDEHYKVYVDRNLSLLGEMTAIPHADDVANADDWDTYYFLVFSMNNAVQKSWSDFAEASDEAANSGCGELAWSCQGGESVLLGFVVSSQAALDEVIESCQSWFGGKPNLTKYLGARELKVGFVDAGQGCESPPAFFENDKTSDF